MFYEEHEGEQDAHVPWNLSAENIQVATEIVMVTAVNTEASAALLERLLERVPEPQPHVLRFVLHALEEVDAVVDSHADAKGHDGSVFTLTPMSSIAITALQSTRHDAERRDDAQGHPP